MSTQSEVIHDFIPVICKVIQCAMTIEQVFAHGMNK